MSGRKKFTGANRTKYYLNESTTTFKLISLLTDSHFVLEDPNTALPYRSLPNTYCKSIAVLLFNYLITHSALPNDKLAHQYKELIKSIQASILTNRSKPLVYDESTITKQVILSPDPEASLPTQIEPPASETITPPVPSSTCNNKLAAARFPCQVCSLSFDIVTTYRAHLRSPEHQQALRSRSPSLQLKEVHNPNSRTLENYIPSSIRFSDDSLSGPKPDEDDQLIKIGSQSFENITNTDVIELTYQEHHENGIIDFKYGNDDDDELLSFPSASQSTRKGQRRLSTENGLRSRSKSKDKSNPHSNPNPDNQHIPETSIKSASPSNNVSNKVGTTVTFISYPSSTNPESSSSPIDSQCYQITSSSHHHPQNIILSSPMLGTIFIPANTSTFSSLDPAAAADDQSGPLKSANKNNKIIQASLYHLFRLCVQTTPIKNTAIPALTAIIMDSGGKCALSIWLGQVIVYHRGFQNYTTRKKQGGSQISHEKSGGRTNTAGGQIRSQQTNRHNERLREMLYHLRGELSCCQQILLYIPSVYTREQLFMSKEQQIKWVQSGGSWIGQNSVALGQPSSLQRSLESDIVSNKDNNSYEASNTAEIEQTPQVEPQFSPNHAFFSSQRDLYQSTADEPFSDSSIPLTTAIPIPNWGYYLRQKYSSAFDHLQNHHRISIDANTGEYQMAYFQRLNKKNSKQLALLTLENSSAYNDDDDDDDVDDSGNNSDHSITAEWHKETLIYHYNHTASILDKALDSTTEGTSSALSKLGSTFQANNTITSNYNNKKIIFVDQFLPHSSSGGSNINFGSFQIDPSITKPPDFSSTLHIASNANQQIKLRKAQHDGEFQSLSSFLEPQRVATVVPSTYSIQPYHPHSIRATFTPQHEYLYLFHRNDPRIKTLSLNVHDAKHDEMLRVYQHLMLCRIKPLLKKEQTDDKDQE
jgi:hypothetical protein